MKFDRSRTVGNPAAGFHTKRTALSRRMLLRGAGVAMALPWLESLPVWGAPIDSATAMHPQRFAALFMACGVNRDHWWAKGAGAEMELGKSLQPMEPLKTKLNVLTGLFNENATGVGIHPGQTGNILSGASLQKGAELRGGISVDQVLANHFEDQTAHNRSPGTTRPISRWPTVPISHGKTRLRRCRWKSILRWRLTAYSTTAAVGATAVCSTAFRSMRNRSIAKRAARTGRSWTNT